MQQFQRNCLILGSAFPHHMDFHVVACTAREDDVLGLVYGCASSRSILYTNLGCASPHFDKGHISLALAPCGEAG